MCLMRVCYSGGTIVAASLLCVVLCAQTERRNENSIINMIQWRICKKGFGGDWTIGHTESDYPFVELAIW